MPSVLARTSDSRQKRTRRRTAAMDVYADEPTRSLVSLPATRLRRLQGYWREGVQDVFLWDCSGY